MSALVVVGGFGVPTVLAAPDQATITANCRAAQSVMGQVEKTDAVLRINRGRAYNDLLDLLFAMNARLASNKIAAPKLSEITADFEQKLATFRADYDKYDDSLTNAGQMNCAGRPAAFYESLTAAREKRAVLAADVANLKQLAGDYQTEFDRIMKGQNGR